MRAKQELACHIEAIKVARIDHANYGGCVALFGIFTIACPGCRALGRLEADARTDYDLLREHELKVDAEGIRAHLIEERAAASVSK